MLNTDKTSPGHKSNLIKIYSPKSFQWKNLTKTYI